MHVFNITLSNIKNFLLKSRDFNKKATNKNIQNYIILYILLVPNFVELIRLPKNYNLSIVNKPKELKKIICSKNYIYLNDFKSNYEVKTY